MAGPVFAGRSDWRELTVGHFHLYSTASDGKTRDFAARLQGFEQTAVAVLNSNSKLPDVPMLIYLTGDRDYKRYLAPRPGTQGFFQQLPFGNLIVVDADAPFDFVATSILHEYTHFIQRNTSTMIFPPWYVEGYAELLSSASLERDRLVVDGDMRIILELGVAQSVDVALESALARGSHSGGISAPTYQRYLRGYHEKSIVIGRLDRHVRGWRRGRRPRPRLARPRQGPRPYR